MENTNKKSELFVELGEVFDFEKIKEIILTPKNRRKKSDTDKLKSAVKGNLYLEDFTELIKVPKVKVEKTIFNLKSISELRYLGQKIACVLKNEYLVTNAFAIAKVEREEELNLKEGDIFCFKENDVRNNLNDRHKCAATIYMQERIPVGDGSVDFNLLDLYKKAYVINKIQNLLEVKKENNVVRIKLGGNEFFVSCENLLNTLKILLQFDYQKGKIWNKENKVYMSFNGVTRGLVVEKIFKGNIDPCYFDTIIL